MIKKIISGGQTGADRGGLEGARALGIETGGYCPKGYLTENGLDLTLKDFGLIEINSKDYRERTIKNIEISDGTVIFDNVNEKGKLKSPGSVLTLNTAIKISKPVVVNPDELTFKTWLIENNIHVLNVAGNRE
ncbi:MAG TPA: putative molybdenum carrier protein, partial [Ignavibacteria bacterium]